MTFFIFLGAYALIGLIVASAVFYFDRDAIIAATALLFWPVGALVLGILAAWAIFIQIKPGRN